MADEKPYRYLNALLAKAEFATNEFREFLSSDARVRTFEVSQEHDFDGVLFVKNSEERKPRWSTLVDAVVGLEVDQLGNKSSSAVLLVRVDGAVFAFTFGYGRYLLNTAYFVQDFGLKTALNTLDQNSLRSVDLHTLEDQPIQKKSQSTRGAEASVFGIDIFRDVLRAVTGSPRPGVEYRNISGGDATYSFGLQMLVSDLPAIARKLLTQYGLDLYKSSFSWVDNIRRVKDGASINTLDARLLEALKDKDVGIVITVPEIIPWDSVYGFSFTRSKRDISPVIETTKYLDNINADALSIESIRRDRLFITDVHENEFNHSIYSCIYFEMDSGDITHVIFGGNWYEIDNAFMADINTVLGQIELTDIDFPHVETWDEEGKAKIEKEEDYNIRAAAHLGCYLLDRKLVKSNKTTSSIELCDLFTQDRQLVHVKHRKGGSAGLSHLFAQGSVSAEVMLGDRAFRKEARKVLGRVHVDARDMVPLDGIRSADYQVVFLILGEENAVVKDGLPFFSKVNLTRAYEGLTQRGYTVKIGGASKVARVAA